MATGRDYNTAEEYKRMTEVVAVFDVGKTNKKILLFDDSMSIIDKRVRHFESARVDGIELEPIDEVREWLLETLSELSGSYTITSVAVSTHGASVVAIDEQGAIACPVVSYTHTPDAGLHQRFYEAVGAKDTLQHDTATAELQPLINVAKLLFFSKEQWPEQFARIRNLLFLPQYFAFVLTGARAADYTYVGCHTYLWDFTAWEWSGVADSLGIRSALPGKPQRSWEQAGTILPEVSERTGIAADVPVTVGIHDSNASLLPYLIKKKNDNFLLNSTGTWCVAMNPGPGCEGLEASFATDEIGKTVFFNISAFGKPVKTAILMGGQEFETYTDILKSVHGTDQLPDFNPSLYQRVIKQAQHFVIPGVLPGTGQFPSSRARIVDGSSEYLLEDMRSGAAVPPLFQDLPAAYAAINLSIALQSVTALRRIGIAGGMAVFTEGGFRHNVDYNVLLAAFLPENPIFLTSIEEATSLGAAITARAAREGKEPAAYADLFDIETFPVAATRFEGLDAYADAFFTLV